MSALKELYLKVKTTIADNVTSIKHFDYWNDNIIRVDEMRPYPTPAVFFEYGSINWGDNEFASYSNCSDRSPIQRGITEFTLHVVIRKNDASGIDKDEINHFDVVHAVYSNINYLQTDSTEGRILRVRESSDSNDGVLRDWKITFVANLIEGALTDIGDTIIDANEDPLDVSFEFQLDVDKPYLKEQ